MDSITTPILRLALILIMSASWACASAPPTSGETRLPAGDTYGFRILDKDFRMVLSHNGSTAPTAGDATELFAVRFLNNSLKNPVVIRFDNEDCDQLISYRIGVQRNSGMTYDYFDNVINLDAAIEIQMTQDDDGKQILLINGRRIPLDIKHFYRDIAVDTDGDHTLSFTGLKPRKINKEQ